jgi:SUN domain-containing protein 1/2
VRPELKTLEDELAAVEGRRSSSGARSRPAQWPSLASALWTTASAGLGSLTIRASDGLDIGALIGCLVDSAVTHSGPTNLLSRPNFALHSAGAVVIPSLKSETYALGPRVGGAVLGLVICHRYAVGRPLVTALHLELHLEAVCARSGSPRQPRGAGARRRLQR